MTSLITFDHATLGYGRRVVLSDISFDIPSGDFLGLVGPNGAGKTTILRAILGSLTPMEGTVTMAPGLRFGYVPQRDSVDYGFPLKVLDVVMMGRYDRKVADLVAKQTGIKVLILPPSVGGIRGAPVNDYVSLMRYDMAQLAAAVR